MDRTRPGASWRDFSRETRENSVRRESVCNDCAIKRVVREQRKFREGLYFQEVKSGAPGESRTPDLLVRSQTLYPAELRARRVCNNLRG